VSDLNDRLNCALGTVDPGPAPVEAAMRHGKRIRNRRRTWAVVGSAAAIAVAAACYPALARQQAMPAPVTSHVRVTVNPPGPHSPAGLIASGTIGTGSWQWLIGKPGTEGASPGQQCSYAGGTLANQFSTTCDESPEDLYDDGSGQSGPVAFEVDSGTDAVLWGQVDPAVSYVTVELGDGTVLTLHPATVYGVWYVAFAVPTGMVVDRATAYSRTGEIGTAIPYQQPGGVPVFQDWLRPGQAVPAQVSGVFGSGTVDGRAWRATAQLGPWGICIVYDGDGATSSGCFDPSQHPTTGATVGSESWVAGTAADSVSYLIVTLKDGSTVRVGVTAVGAQRFWGVGLGAKAQTGARWTAYNAEGKQVASGSAI
jgi:hypothetical protein